MQSRLPRFAVFSLDQMGPRPIPSFGFGLRSRASGLNSTLGRESDPPRGECLKPLGCFVSSQPLDRSGCIPPTIRASQRLRSTNKPFPPRGWTRQRGLTRVRNARHSFACSPLLPNLTRRRTTVNGHKGVESRLSRGCRGKSRTGRLPTKRPTAIQVLPHRMSRTSHGNPPLTLRPPGVDVN